MSRKVNWEKKYTKLDREVRKANEYAMARERTRYALYTSIIATLSLFGTLSLIVGRLLGWF